MARRVYYRKRKGDNFWHFCKNCEKWPMVSYEERGAEYPPMGGFCLDCIQKHREGNCEGFTESNSTGGDF
jgi:hypothetical protein